MELLFSLIPVEVAFATGSVNSSFFSTLTAGANMFVGIIKWAALLFVLVKIAMLGFKVATQAKNSADAIKTVKDEGLALAIGLFIVMTAFMIHGALKDTVNTIGNTGSSSSDGGTIDFNNKDVFSTP